MQGVVPPEEPPQDLSDGGLPHEQSRPESPEDQAVQDLRDSLSQGSLARVFVLLQEETAELQPDHLELCCLLLV